MLCFNPAILKFGALLALVIPSIIGAPFNTRAEALNNRKTISSLLEKRQDVPFQTITEAVQTSFAEQEDGIFQLIDADGDGLPDLCLIKTSNTTSGTVEISILSAVSNYQTLIWESGSAYIAETDGTWILVPASDSTVTLPDLVFIKTSHTTSQTTEVHFCPGSTAYQLRGTEIKTPFAEEVDGTWTMFDFDGDSLQDLVFIKTSNTASGKVEVLVASGVSLFQEIIYESSSAFVEETDGVWALVEASAFTGNADLSFVKTSNDGSGTIEVYTASSDSDYETRPIAASSAFGPDSNGVWALADINHDDFLDLVFIKTQNTGTGFVEINAASGKDIL